MVALGVGKVAEGSGVVRDGSGRGIVGDRAGSQAQADRPAVRALGGEGRSCAERRASLRCGTTVWLDDLDIFADLRLRLRFGAL